MEVAAGRGSLCPALGAPGVHRHILSFRYVRNLLEGHGLVFNPGEYVEGYSNFLWVLELAAIWGLSGVAPERVAPWLSVAFTAGTIAAMLWWITRLPSLSHRGLVGWMALGLVCSSATFAVWTSGGGLETRQFTFFVVLAVMCLSLYRDSRRGLLVVSLSLAAALTRPEGALLAALCCGLGATISSTVRWISTGRYWLSPRPWESFTSARGLPPASSPARAGSGRAALMLSSRRMTGKPNDERWRLPQALGALGHDLFHRRILAYGRHVVF